ncbi:ras association domain-containing protein 10 [Genypterus blacodes]|uniref:ras association domain-containing protein 10 n=1 Tax=Genypterus blacodes TaxID=154954 RepID=UPI003F769211
MELEECQVSVWVCREEKLVLGLSRRTTCADVVTVLLEDQHASSPASASSSARSQAYCIVEKWRGFERILPKQTKILRLWDAWGDEQQKVKFVLVKTAASVATRGARSAEARVVLSRRSPCAFTGSARAPMGAVSPEKQRRIVRKAFRKLEKMKKKKRVKQTEHRDAEKMETLVHLVLSQDHTVRQQVQRITELDLEIERCEAKVHFDRMKRLGVNYVQDTYLVGATDTPGQEGERQVVSAETLVRFEEVLRLQEKLWEQEALMDHITVQIQEELNRRWMRRRREKLRGREGERVTGGSPRSERRTGGDASTETELLMEGERLQTQLDVSSYIGLRVSTDLEAIRGDLKVREEIWGAKDEEMRDLMEKVGRLDMEEGPGREETCEQTDEGTGSVEERKSEWVEQVRGRCKGQGEDHNDDDSDTGLSSLHSQDSDMQPVCESLV